MACLCLCYRGMQGGTEEEGESIVIMLSAQSEFVASAAGIACGVQVGSCASGPIMEIISNARLFAFNKRKLRGLVA